MFICFLFPLPLRDSFEGGPDHGWMPITKLSNKTLAVLEHVFDAVSHGMTGEFFVLVTQPVAHNPFQPSLPDSFCSRVLPNMSSGSEVLTFSTCWLSAALRGLFRHRARGCCVTCHHFHNLRMAVVTPSSSENIWGCRCPATTQDTGLPQGQGAALHGGRQQLLRVLTL